GRFCPVLVEEAEVALVAVDAADVEGTAVEDGGHLAVADLRLLKQEVAAAVDVDPARVLVGEPHGEGLVELREQVLQGDLVDAEADLEGAVLDGALHGEAAGVDAGALPDEPVAVVVAGEI